MQRRFMNTFPSTCSTVAGHGAWHCGQREVVRLSKLEGISEKADSITTAAKKSSRHQRPAAKNQIQRKSRHTGVQPHARPQVQKQAPDQEQNGCLMVQSPSTDPATHHSRNHGRSRKPKKPPKQIVFR
jgi:hypothetical protein